jgi:hypothetical protein
MGKMLALVLILVLVVLQLAQQNQIEVFGEIYATAFQLRGSKDGYRSLGSRSTEYIQTNSLYPVGHSLIS